MQRKRGAATGGEPAASDCGPRADDGCSQADGRMAGLKSELSERDEEKSSLQMELEESKALVSASHAREDALRKGMSDLRSVRVVDYILSRPDLAANLVTHQPTDAGHAGGRRPRTQWLVRCEQQRPRTRRSRTGGKRRTAGAHVRPTADEIALFAPSLGVDPATESNCRCWWMKRWLLYREPVDGAQTGARG